MRLAVGWRTDEPDRLAQRLTSGLGVDPEIVAGADASRQARVFDFQSGHLTVVQVDPGTGTGLVVDDAAPDMGTPATLAPAGATAARPTPEPGPDLVAIGWATVDIDRAATDLGVDLVPLPADDVLGARASLAVARIDETARTRGILPAGRLILLEPTTEGRLAAALVRFGEGPAALYFVDPRADRGWSTSRVAAGPFGQQALLPGGPRWGPHLVLGSRALVERNDAGTMPR